MKEKEIELLYLETGLLWPHYKKKKARSANSLTKILREMEYQDIPLHILQKAAERGKNFHKVVQKFFQTGSYPSFVDLSEKNNLSNLEKRVYETINFLKKSSSLKTDFFVGDEKLHYIFHKDELLATYIDLEFQDFIIELKTSNVKSKEKPLTLLTFEIQLLIQHLCTGKDIYLLWSTGCGVIFEKFQLSPYLLKTLDILIDLNNNESDYSPKIKQAIIQEIVTNYAPPQFKFC